MKKKFLYQSTITMNRFFSALFLCLCCCTQIFATADSSFVIFPPDFHQYSFNNNDVFGDPVLSGKPIVNYAFGCGGHETTYKDSVVSSETNFCRRIIRTWTVKHICVSSTIVKTHKQMIFMSDASAPTIVNTPTVEIIPSDFCSFSLKINPIEAKDFSGVASVLAQLIKPGSSVPIQTRSDFPAKMILDSTYQGKMMFVRYIVTDNCGNFKSQDIAVTLPTKALFVTCKNRVEKTILNSGKIIVEAKEFIDQMNENCQKIADVASIKFEKINLVSNCYSISPLSVPKAIDTLGLCTGTHNVKLWIKSTTGAEAFCFSTIRVSNPNNIATPACNTVTQIPIDLCVEIKTYKGQPINAQVDFEGEDAKGVNGFNCIKTSDCFTNVWLNFAKKDVLTNGVSTLDLILISKHILGIQPISTPYGLLAADANKDGKITTADLVELRKIILGIKTFYIDNESWRFYDEKYKPNPMIMMSEYKSVTKKIIAIKIGDIDGNAVAN